MRDRTAFIRMGGRLVVLLVAALVACGESVPALPKLGPDDVIVAFGDSLTYGTGAAAEESYPAVLSTLIGRKVVREGVPGEVTAQGLQRLPDVLEEDRPKLLLLCLGGNDMLHKIEPSQIEHNLRAMVELARSRGVAVVLIGVPKPQLFGGGSADFYERVARDYGLPLESGILKGVLFDNQFKSDPIHPNGKGYRRMAEAVAVLLRKAGAV
ncbi:MAG TPA: arylesterase [Burkholderiales bacterium]|nr:arylesterase [Burkholderiales bacterium]